MDENQTFLAAIIADPSDVSPRLIYADWLEEQGNTEADYWRFPFLGELHARLWNQKPGFLELSVVPQFEARSGLFVWSYRFKSGKLWHHSQVWREVDLDRNEVQFIITEMQWDLETELHRAWEERGKSTNFEIPF